jgi:CDGSH-type Zn-finger protein
MLRRADQTPATTVVPYPDGPLIVRGDFELCDVAGNPIERGARAVALCRCGRSAAKPFCDGSHKRAAVSEPAPRAARDAASARNGRLA